MLGLRTDAFMASTAALKFRYLFPVAAHPFSL